MGQKPELDYRPDIDGIRAVAVLCVVVFHGFPRMLPSGFIGVDIFFVISGYLISGIILRTLQAGTFSYSQFYARRIKRIFPALLTVLAATILAGFFLLLPDELKALGKQVAAGAGFASNLLLWHDAGYFGYFDVSLQVNPLLHLWSLGIEEQFYLTWPLILGFLAARKWRLSWIISALAIASFVWSVVLVRHSAIAAFYSPLPRFWELLAGAGLAGALVFQSPEVEAGGGRKIAADALAWAGVLLLAAGFVLITQQQEFPGYWVLLPVAGTACLIAARPRAWFNRRILSNRALVFVGLISYPLYLWHWVLLAMLRARVDLEGGEAPRFHRIGAVALSFLLAWLTYLLIERPIRFAKHPVLRPTALVALMALTGAVGALAFASDGAAYRLPAQLRPLAAMQYPAERDLNAELYRSRRCFLDLDQRFESLASECFGPGSAAKRLLMLWGDSHAASLYPGIKSVNDKTGIFRIAQFTAAGCAPVVSDAAHDSHLDRCGAFESRALNEIIQLKPDVVLLEADWWLHCMADGKPNLQILQALQQTVERLKSAGVKRVVVFGSLPVWDIPQPRVMIKLWRSSGVVPQRTMAYLNRDSMRIDESTRQVAARSGALFVSPIRQLCDLRGCLLSVEPDRAVPIAWDSAHLSEAGSKMLMAATLAQAAGT